MHETTNKELYNSLFVIILYFLLKTEINITLDNFVECKEDVITVKNTNSVESVVKILSDNNINSYPVVNADGCIGIVDMLDILSHVVQIAPTRFDKQSLESAMALKEVAHIINKSGKDPYNPLYSKYPATLAVDMFSCGANS